MFFNMQGEIKQILSNLVDDTMLRNITQGGKTDIWTSQIDWSSKKITGIKNDKLSAKAQAAVAAARVPNKSRVVTISDVIDTVCNSKPDKPKHYTGAPDWYRKLCPKAASYHDLDWKRGPTEISISTKIAPLLLRLSCHEFPLYRTHHHGWGYLVPKSSDDALLDQALVRALFPDTTILDPVPGEDTVLTGNIRGVYLARVENLENQQELFTKKGDTPCILVQRDFTHITLSSTKVGNVGNPLGKMFTDSIEDGTIATSGDWEAQQVRSFWVKVVVRGRLQDILL